MKRFYGIYVAIVTPFTDSMKVDYDRLRDHVDWLIQNGVHGLVPVGSVGEYAALDDEERAKVVETVVEAAAGRVPVVVGTGAPSTQKAVGWAEHAKRIGASGIMALPPINYNPTRSEVISFYQSLSDVGLPIIAYNNPFDTKVDLTPDLLAELCKLEHVVAVKEFSGDIRRIHEIYEKTDLEVLAGADDLALEGLLAGATGWIAGFTNSHPKESVELFNFAINGKVAEATQLYRRLLPLFRYDSTPRLVQSIKYALELVGRPVGKARAPRLDLTNEEKESIEKANQCI
ncbi:dihydrodipicolinate synthase family protein [Baia soyae]|uniref:4-hydroxy-tetrahydrodipicolinate synthase n=1 Tax=Baia soyae TaxID=1544746 RepID=A0A4R2SBE0_9BACL|nr:dihydrodipicolinate synthase family protein [Baia soyae]TCP69927.1 4-hydroxy-tetrahydrodipicolinate synthase [Baia soyae]